MTTTQVNTGVIAIPAGLLDEIQHALNTAKNFRFRGEMADTSYKLASQIDAFRRTATQLDTVSYPATDQPSSCPFCGTRTIQLESKDNDDLRPSEEIHWCRSCGSVHRVDFS
jgi:hypothetical protein